MALTTISPQELAAKKQNGESVELIDVRTPIEFQEIHCNFARNVPLYDLDPQTVMKSRNGTQDKPLYLICRSGSRGKQACEKFLAAGFTNIVNVDGGTMAWAAAGLPVQRGQKVISIERQVQIVTGLLVLTGAVLGYFVRDYFIGLSALMGAGLLYSGLSNTCGMGMILARMPWNRISASCSVNSNPGATK